MFLKKIYEIVIFCNALGTLATANSALYCIVGGSDNQTECVSYCTVLKH